MRCLYTMRQTSYPCDWGEGGGGGGGNLQPPLLTKELEDS